MATVALQVVGNLIYPGIGGAIGAGVGAVIDSVVGTAIARKLTAQDATPPEIPKNPGVDQGVPAPWVHGSAIRVPGTVIYVSETRQVPIYGDEKGKSAGTVAGYDYFVDIAIAWCRNMCDTDPVRKIWASSELIYSINAEVSFDVDIYGMSNVDNWFEFSRDVRTEDGKPWCNRNKRPTRRVVQRDQDMALMAPVGSDLDNLMFALTGSLHQIDVTVAGCINADNNGTFFCTGYYKKDFTFTTPGNPGVTYNIYAMVLRRCNLEYPDPNLPCEPDPTPCDPTVTENVDDDPTSNTITISAFVPNFSKYFTTIRNYTGNPDSPVTSFSQPNVSADPIITADPEIEFDTVPAYRGTCYTAIEGLNITKWGGTMPQFEAQIRERFTGTPYSALEALMARSEAQDAIANDLTPLDANPRLLMGISTAGPTPPANQIKEILNHYDIEAQEIQQYVSGSPLPVPVLRFTPQEDLETVAVPYENTSAREAETSGRVHALIKRGSRDDLPQEFIFDYTDSTRDLQPSTTTYTVRTGTVQNRQKLGTTIVYRPEDADTTAKRLLWKAINFSDRLEFEAPAAQLDIVEGDRIILSPIDDNGTSLRARVTQMTRGENGLIEVKAEIDDGLSYEQLESGGYAPEKESYLSFAPPGQVIPIDIAPLTSDDATRFGIYLALQAQSTSFAGSYGLYYSTDQVNWTTALQLSAAAVTGHTTTVLAEPTGHTHWDDDNTVRVQIFGNGTLETLTKEEVSAGLNRAYVGGEIIGFTTATLVASTTLGLQDYELSGLLRARRDSAEFLVEHQIGEHFVMLPPSGGGVGFVPLDPSLYGIDVYLRTVPAGGAISDASVVANEIIFTPSAETLRPFSVHGVWAIRRPDYSTCVWATERTRVPFRIFSALTPPTVETGGAEEYKANVYTLNATLDDWVLRRTLSGCFSVRKQVSFEYTRAMIITDLVDTGIIADPSDVGETLFEIYRESDTIGPGRQTEFAVTGIGPEFVGTPTIEPPA